ncbi:hypothetical protein [Atopobacter phocae]|uniref:hypothetical protein n=1 Tax=Atopobacter phocae TaxID=136492 RepID=UPI0004717D0E|nr:hypothetical protein [Atopobacter phocae]
MKKVMSALRFILRNGETWTVNRNLIGDLWIKQVSTSFGRINGGGFQEIHPCESIKIEILPEADSVLSEDINLGGLESGMFERVMKHPDIEMMDILYRDLEHPKSDTIVAKDRIYFPYTPEDEDGNDNGYQSSKLGKDNHLYLVIDPNNHVDDIYPEV